MTNDAEAESKHCHQAFATNKGRSGGLHASAVVAVTKEVKERRAGACAPLQNSNARTLSHTFN